MSKYRLHHVAVPTRDWDESLQFYTDVLGMRMVAEFSEPERRLCLLADGSGGHIELYGPSVVSPTSPSTTKGDPFNHIALGTDDTRAAIESVRALGYEVTYEPHALRVGELDTVIAFFKGPNGESIEFFEVRS